MKTKIVTSDVIIVCTQVFLTNIALSSRFFLTRHQEDLHPKFKKKFDLESANFIIKTTRYLIPDSIVK